MIRDVKKLERALVERARELGNGCKKAFVAVSGGVDSSLVAVILCKAYEPENVVGLYRDIKNDPKHWQDVSLLRHAFGFKLLHIDGNPLYDEFIRQAKTVFEENDLPWADEGTPEAAALGFDSAYASAKSRFTTPMAGFIAKAVDGGKGRIFGTGNAEEDGFLRYFDKYGDGAVDNNLINGLNKSEVRQLAAYTGVPERIVTKTPSADLHCNGDAHNDEDQLTCWARGMGFDIKLSYGSADGSQEGNIAWALRENLMHGIIDGHNADLGGKELSGHYSSEQIQLILFLRAIEKSTRHKALPIPGLDRRTLIEKGLVE